MNVLPSTAASWSSRRSSGVEPVEPRGDERVQRLGHVERLDLARRSVDVAVALEQPAVEQHAHRLDGVEGDALGPAEDLPAQLVGQAGDEPVEQLSHRLARTAARATSVVALRPPAPNVGLRSSSSGRASASTKSGWLRDHSSRYSMKSSSPASAHCRSSKTSTTGPLLGEPLEEEPPGREEVLPVGGGPLGRGRAGARAAARARPAPPRRRRAPRSRRASFASAELGRLLLEDPRPHPHHLGERPVRDALAVGEAAAAVPPDVVGEPVDVLLELPGEARLADPGDADDRDELRLALLRASCGRAP